MEDFDQPSSGTWFKPAEHEGSLILVVQVHELIDNHFDSYKNAEVERMEFDFVDLDDGTGELQANVYDTHPGIVRKLKSALRRGNGVLGVIGKVPTDKGNPAWVLGSYDENADHAARAKAWLASRATPKFNEPATPASSGASTPARPAQAASVAAKTQDGATPATAPAASDDEDLRVNGVKVDPEQYDKLAALGIVPARAGATA